MKTTEDIPKTEVFEREGDSFIGVAVVALQTGYEFAIVAPDIETLRAVWRRIMATDIEEAGIQHVRIGKNETSTATSQTKATTD